MNSLINQFKWKKHLLSDSERPIQLTYLLGLMKWDAPSSLSDDNSRKNEDELFSRPISALTGIEGGWLVSI